MTTIEKIEGCAILCTDDYRGQYRGVGISVIHFTRESASLGDEWCGYVHVLLDRLTDANRKQFDLPVFRVHAGTTFRRRYDYNGPDFQVMNDLPFHGGITYYQKDLDYDAAKIGCHYSHANDHPGTTTLEIVWRDMMQVVDALLQIAPELES